MILIQFPKTSFCSRSNMSIIWLIAISFDGVIDCSLREFIRIHVSVIALDLTLSPIFVKIIGNYYSKDETDIPL